MALHPWNTDPELGKTPCKSKHETWRCPNLKSRKDDQDMNYEHYDCELCGAHVALDYEEMK